MTGTTHRVLGLTIGTGVAVLHPVLGMAALMEIPSALRLGGLITSQAILGLIVAGAPDWDLRVGLPHRGPTHSVIVCLLATLVIGAAAYAWLPGLAVDVTLVVGLALASHLMADLSNPTPMALLWPLLRRRIRPGWLPAARENSLRGRLVEVVSVVALLAVLMPVVGPRLVEELR